MKTETPDDKRLQIANKVFYLTLAVNTLLMALKFAAGFLGESSALISDAVNDLSDVGITLMVIVGVRFASKSADKEHPYGHGRIESVVGLSLAFILVMTALGIGKSGVETLFSGRAGASVPGLIALIAAFISILCKEGLYQIAHRTAKKIGSSAMLADAWHHRSDALSSLAAFIGIGATQLGLWFMEPAASLAICLLILKTAYDIGKGCVHQLIDASPPQDVLDAICETVLSVEGVRHIDLMRSRVSANKLYVDLEIALLHILSFEQAHILCEKVHLLVEKRHPQVIHCTVHANPHHHDDVPVELPEDLTHE
ncbi:MAG: cation diffusion facilitator family transporter [Christensenellales bacterium]